MIEVNDGYPVASPTCSIPETLQGFIPLGEMPIEMDLLFEPNVPIASLPYPYNLLEPRTIGEFKIDNIISIFDFL